MAYRTPGRTRTCSGRNTHIATPPAAWLLGFQGQEPGAPTTSVRGDSDTSSTTLKVASHLARCRLKDACGGTCLGDRRL